MASSPAHRAGSLVRRALFGLAFLAIAVAGGAWLLDASIEPDGEAEAAVISSATDARASLSGIKSWAYQLGALDVAVAAASSLDMLVVDPAGLEKAQVDLLRVKPDGSRRMVLAHLNAATEIAPRATRLDAATPDVASGVARLAAPLLTTGGNSANSDDAPQQGMAGGAVAPPWLADGVPGVPGARRVRYWEAGWQSLVFGSAESAVDRILAAGFDGVYLDHGDAHMAFEAERPSAGDDMVAFLIRLAEYARGRSADFRIVVQRTESFRDPDRLFKSIDAVAHEALLLNAADGSENPEEVLEASLVRLQAARRAGKAIFVLEHATGRPAAETVRQRLTEWGYVPGFPTRNLDRIATDL